MNPLALMVKAPNIGGIVAQNEAAQAQVNDNALVRQLNLAKVQAAQQQLMKQQQLSDLFKTGKIDPYSEQGIAQIASIDAEAAKPYMDLYSEKLKNTREDKRLDFEGRKTNAQEANYQNLIQTRTANTSSMISDRRASRMLAEMRFDREQTKAALDARKGLTEQNRAALLDYAAAVNAVPEAERAAAVPLIKEQIARVHGADTVDDLPDYDPNTNRVIQAVAAISAPKSGSATKTKEQDAVNDPAYKIPGYELTGEVVPAKTALTKLRTQTAAINTVARLSNELADLVEKNGVSDIPDATKREYERIYNQIQFAYKEARALGALQQGEIDLMAKGIPNPASKQSMIDKLINPQIDADKTVVQGLKSFASAIKLENDDLLAQSGYAPKQAQQQPTTPQGGMQQAPQQSNNDEPFVVDF